MTQLCVNKHFWQLSIAKPDQNVAAANRAPQSDSLKDRLSHSEKQFQQQLIQTEELQSVITQIQAEKQKLEGEIKLWGGKEQKHQMQVTELNQQLSRQQEQLLLASERTAQANAQLGEEQQAVSDLQQDLYNLKQQAAATDTSRQYVEQQLKMTKQQLQEKEQTLTDMADQLDALTSAVAAKEGSIQLLRQQVLCLPACCICSLCLTFSALRSRVCLVHACISIACSPTCDCR